MGAIVPPYFVYYTFHLIKGFTGILEKIYL